MLLLGASLSAQDTLQQCVSVFPPSEYSDVYEVEMNSLIEKYKEKENDGGVITIPVIFHVANTNLPIEKLYQNLEQVNDQFRRKQLSVGWNNDPDGADTYIEFCPATEDEDGNTLINYGIDMIDEYGWNFPIWGLSPYVSIGQTIEWNINPLKEQTIWDPEEYLNIWILDLECYGFPFLDIDGNTIFNVPPKLYVIGFGTFPDVVPDVLPGLDFSVGIGTDETDGVVLDYKFVGTHENPGLWNTNGLKTDDPDGRYSDLALGNALTHEIGHFLGLRHPWGDGSLTPELGCLVDDYCEDTPNTFQPNRICNGIGDVHCDSENTTMVENYMDYTPQYCQNVFTNNQTERMQTSLDVVNNIPRRSMLGQSTKCEIPPCELLAGNEIINSNNHVVWNTGPKYQSVVIHNNASLTVESEIYMMPNTNITVKPGGKLIVKGTLTSCDENWGGVIVEGEQLASQDPIEGTDYIEQGYVHLKPASEINNAILAVDIQAGGILNAERAYFKNNRKAVVFQPFENHPYNDDDLSTDIINNASRFINCIFENDETFEDFFAFAMMRGVRGIKFNGCKFINNSTQFMNFAGQDWYGAGIMASNSNFVVQLYCDAVDPGTSWVYECEDIVKSEFAGLSFGVTVSNHNEPDKNFKVKEAIFEKCNIGISSHGVDNAFMALNRFQLGEVKDPSSMIQDQIGIYLGGDQSNFNIEENTFLKSSSSNFDDNIGIIASNIGLEDNILRRNNFTDLKIGNLSSGENQLQNGTMTSGLTYQCNDNTNVSDYDFAVPDDDFYDHEGVRVNQDLFEIDLQGNFVQYPVANHFSKTNDNSDFFNGAQDLNVINEIRYHVYGNAPLDQQLNPISYRTNEVLIEDENLCEQNFYSDQPPREQRSRAQLRTEFDEVQSRWHESRNEYYALIDGDGTNLVSATINNPNTLTSLSQDLLNKSPFLSTDEVLALIQNHQSLTNADLIDILLANPEVLSTLEVQEALSVILGVFSNTELESLQSVNSIGSFRSEMENNIDYLRREMNYYGGCLLNKIVEEERIHAQDVYNLYQEMHTLNLDFKRITYHLKRTEWSSMEDILSSLPTKYRYNAHQMTNHEALMSTIEYLRDEVIQHDVLDEEMTAKLLSTYYENTGMARTLAGGYYTHYTSIPLIDYTLPRAIESRENKEEKLVRNQQNKVHVVPNPAQDIISFSCLTCNEIKNDVYLEVIAIDGSSVDKQLLTKDGAHYYDLDHLNSAVYLYRIYTAKEIIQTGKFIVSK